MSGHSLEPWSFRPLSGDDGLGYIEAADGRDIMHAGVSDRPREENVANSLLAAAAPEMLGALKLALEYWAHRQQRYKNRSPVWVQDARAAITKATGK